ncbi:hypothetical protein [Falsiroseomonas sp. E2-1-a20]|uniref:hypothetical protein n=1 Tax=Falsiroseomonas sp. E2-1-a20 TaxID=3239300 RepID=UPI003F39B0DB
MPPLRRSCILPPGTPKAPPPGQGFVYELADAVDGAAVYVGVTCRHPSDRLAQHVSIARYRRGTNRRLTGWIRRLAESGSVLIMRVVSQHAAGPELVAAEQARIAALRATLGSRLLNLGPGGESAPAGRLVPDVQRERARLARRARQRDDDYRRNLSAACSRRRHKPASLNALVADFAVADPAVPMTEICRRHGIGETHLIGILAGTHNNLVLEPDLLAAARVAQSRRVALRQAEETRIATAVAEALRAYLAAAPGTALAEVARGRGMDPRRLQEILRRGEHGIADGLARAVQARMAENLRLRGRVLGRRARRIDRRWLRWLLTAYARPGSRLTLVGIAGRLGATQSAISHILAGCKGPPLPRSLAIACRRRAHDARLASLRGRGPVQ